MSRPAIEAIDLERHGKGARNKKGGRSKNRKGKGRKGRKGRGGMATDRY
jgi:hypothetical protein